MTPGCVRSQSTKPKRSPTAAGGENARGLDAIRMTEARICPLTQYVSPTSSAWRNSSEAS